MTPEARFDQAYASAMHDRHNLIQFLNGISDDQARWSPPDGEWSIAQGLEHIMLTEAYVRTNILNILRRAEADDIWDTASDNPVKMSAEALRRRDQGVVIAPQVLDPQGERDFQEMIADLVPDREASREALTPYRSRELSGLVLPHPTYGERNLYDVIEYSGIHDYLHHEQMTRVTQQSGYPAA